MSHCIQLRPEERSTLLGYYRTCSDPALRLRAHIILLLDDGHGWALIAALLFGSSRTIARWKNRFQRGRLAALGGHPRGRRPRWGDRWVAVLVGWVTRRLPRDFGFLRSRWCCAALVVVLLEVHQVAASRETVRRWLHRGGLVWRRPRPVVGPRDPQRAATLRALRGLLARLPDDETAVFQDEVDINSNPKVGSMWMRRGEQAAVPTPGTNAKRYLAGSLHWRTGLLIVTEAAPGGPGRRAVRAAPGGPAAPAAALSQDPRPVRQRPGARLPGGAGVPGALGRADRVALPAEVRPGDEPHRAAVVASA